MAKAPKGMKICSRGHAFKGPAPCPVCWPNGRVKAKRVAARKAADIAHRVLRYFEKERPRDQRPRKAIAAIRAWTRGEMPFVEVRKAALAAHAAARAAKKPAAVFAARAAGQAASIAHSLGHAAGAKWYADKVSKALREAKKK